MHVQIVNFNLKGMSDQEWRAFCDEVAPAFAAVPGLLSKVWLADGGANTYGGVYLWRDQRAMEEYAQSDLFQGVVSNPHLANITSKDFSAMEGPSRVTRGMTAAGV